MRSLFIIHYCCTSFIPSTLVEHSTVDIFKKCHRGGGGAGGAGAHKIMGSRMMSIWAQRIQTRPAFHIIEGHPSYSSRSTTSTTRSGSLLSMLHGSTGSDADNSQQQRQRHTTSTPEETELEQDSQYKKKYYLSGIGTKSHVFVKTNTNHTLQTDVPRTMGGGDVDPQPLETLLAAWMGCTQATAMFVGRNLDHRIFIGKIEFENIIGYRDERGALGGAFPFTLDSELPDIPSGLEKVEGVVKVFAIEQKRQRQRRYGIIGRGIQKAEGDMTSNNDERYLLSQEQLRILGEHTERRCPVGKSSINSRVNDFV